MIIFLHSNGKRQVMVALFIISLFTSFFVFGEEDTSIYQKRILMPLFYQPIEPQKYFRILGAQEAIQKNTSKIYSQY
jgi:hypothetical protein